MLAFGAISGVAMVAAGMPNYLAMLMSVLVYAGSSQLAALQLLASGSPVAIAILAAADPRWRPLLSYLLTDNGYAMALRGHERPLGAADKVWY